RLDPGRSGGDRPFPRHAAAAVVAAVAFAPLLASAAQVGVERPPGRLVRPDVAVDGLVADLEAALAPQPTGHLLGTPVLDEEDPDPLQVRARELPIASGVRAPAAGVPVGERGTVGAVAAGAIPPDLPEDGAPVPPEGARDRGRAQAASPQHAERISFREGDLVIRHT